MQYLTLLYDAEANANEYGTPEFAEEMAGYERFGELAATAIVGGEALMPASTTRTVHHGEGTSRVTAGPFAETTEVLGGFYVLEADTLDDVIELARQIPAVRTGSIEIRPLVQWVDASARDDAGEASGTGTTRWMCTLHGDESPADDPADPAWAAGADAHGRFGADAGAAVLAAGAVQPTATATTIRVRDGELQVSDGPPEGTTSVVGGVYVLAADEDSILELAGRIPVDVGGAVEVRPVMEFGG
jgi:hypothetical protein